MRLTPQTSRSSTFCNYPEKIGVGAIESGFEEAKSKLFLLVLQGESKPKKPGLRAGFDLYV